MRLFVAVNLPAAERRAAHAATASLRASALPVRWVGEEALHITLQFLGEVEQERAAAIGAALVPAVAPAKPFTLTLGGFGVFPHERRPTALWLGVEHHPALELLANDVARALAPLGFAAELRPFRPHVTIGRARRGARAAQFGALASLAESVAWEAVVTVDHVDLMESTLGGAGATYRTVHRAALAGDGA